MCLPRSTIGPGFVSPGRLLKRLSTDLRLHILLRSPRLSLDQAESSTLAVLAGAANCILRTYSELAGHGALNPSFCQIRRIVTAGQLVIICALEDQWYGPEAHELLQIAQHLVGLHRKCWTQAAKLSEDFGLIGDALCKCGDTSGELITKCLITDPACNQ